MRESAWEVGQPGEVMETADVPLFKARALPALRRRGQCQIPTGADTKKSLLAASVFCHNHEAVRVRYNDLLAPPLHESLILPGT